MRRKTVFSVGAALLICLLLAACGSLAPASSGASAATSPSQGDTETDAMAVYLQSQWIQYDGAGEVAQRMEYTYVPESDRLLMVTLYDAQGSVVYEERHTYDEEGRYVRLERTGEEPMLEEWTYDSRGNITNIVSTYACAPEMGQWTDYTYDAQGRTLSIHTHNEDGSVFRLYTMTYDAAENCLKRHIVTSNGPEEEILETNEYDSAGRLVRQSEQNMGDPTQSFTYDYTYNDEGQLLRIQYDNGNEAQGLLQSFVYDSQSNLLEESNQYGGGEGERNVYTYDQQGRQLTAHHYDLNGVLQRWNEHVYDARGNVVKTVYAMGDGSISSYEEMTYNEAGLVVREVSHNGEYTTEYQYTYDDKGQMLRTQRLENDQMMSATECDYDDAGNMVETRSWYGDELVSRQGYEYMRVELASPQVDASDGHDHD